MARPTRMEPIRILARRALEGMLARQRFVEDHAERVDVGPLVDGGAGELLGRHVADGADREPAAGHLGEAAHPRHAEVDELHRGDAARLSRVSQHGGIGQVDVGRLDVAVDDPARVGGGEAVGQAAHDRQELERAHRPLPGQARREGLALQQLHGQKERAVRQLADLADLHDRRVVDRRQRRAFPPEALGGPRVARQLRAHQLERHPRAARRDRSPRTPIPSRRRRSRARRGNARRAPHRASAGRGTVPLPGPPARADIRHPLRQVPRVDRRVSARANCAVVEIGGARVLESAHPGSQRKSSGWTPTARARPIHPLARTGVEWRGRRERGPALLPREPAPDASLLARCYANSFDARRARTVFPGGASSGSCGQGWCHSRSCSPSARLRPRPVRGGATTPGAHTIRIG